MSAVEPVSETTAADLPAGLVGAVREVRGYYDADNYEAALDACGGLLRDYPDSAEGKLLLGLVSYALDEPTQGILLLEEAQKSAPDIREYADALASIYAIHGRVPEALYFAKMAAILPQHPLGDQLLPANLARFFDNLYFNNRYYFRQRARNMLEKNSPARAVTACEKQLELTPDDIATLRLLARAALETGDTTRAVDVCRTVIQTEPSAEDHVLLVEALVCASRYDEAEAALTEATQAFPTNAELAQAGIRMTAARFGSTGGKLADANRRWVEDHTCKDIPEGPAFANPLDPDRTLRIGYIGNNDRDGAVMSALLTPILAAHDRDRFRIHCYTVHRTPTQADQSLHALSYRCTDINGIDPDTTAAILRGDGIDIAVDMIGHGAGSQLDMIYRQPAPLRLGWLGEALPAGDGFDYLLADKVLAPPGTVGDTNAPPAWPLTHGALAVAFSGTPEHCSVLPARQNGYITIGVVAPLAELGPMAIEQWQMALAACPGARIALYNRDNLDIPATKRLTDLVDEAGMLDRIDIIDRSENAGRSNFTIFSQFDIVLDPQPNSCFIETCRSLWMGVPVLATVGEGYLGRRAASALTAAGKSDWVCGDNAQLAERLNKLTADPQQLATMRETLRTGVRQTPLFDTGAFTRDLEAAYRAMWQNWCAAKQNG